MRIALLDEDMAVEAAHFRNRKYADGAEGLCRNRKDFALGDVGAELAVSRALQPVECDVARKDIAFKGSVRHFDRQ